MLKALINKSMRYGDNLGLSLTLAWIYKNNKVLPVDLAFEVAKNDIRSPRSVIVNRVQDHFKTLFAHKYKQLFGDGMELKIAARERVIEYGPASPTLLHYRSTSKKIPPLRIQDVLGIQSQFKPLVQIWTECIEELRPLNCKVAKGTKVGTREEYHALPETLKAESDHPDKEKWDKVVAEYAKKNGISILPISKLATIQGFDPRPKLTFKQSEDLAFTANEIGFLLIPDIRITCRTYGWDEIISIIRPIGKPLLPKSESYQSASIMLELGFAIAAADGKIDNEEINFIVQTLESQFTLDPAEACCLMAYREVLIVRPPSLSGITKKLSTVLNDTQKEIIGKFLIGVASIQAPSHLKSSNFDLNIKISKELLGNLDNRFHIALADLIQRETWSNWLRYPKRVPFNVVKLINPAI